MLVAALLLGLLGHAAAEADGTVRCFERRYTPGHLRDHPNQRLKSLRLDILVKTVPPERLSRPGEPVEGFDDADVSVMVRLRRPEHKTWGKGICRAEGNRFNCKMECDAGDFKLTLAPGALRVEFERLALDGCGNPPDLTKGRTDDRIAILRQLPADRCLKDIMGAENGPK